MKKGDMIQGVITDYDFPNKGSFIYYPENQETNKAATNQSAADVETKASSSTDGDSTSEAPKGTNVTIKGALPGSEVRARVFKKKSGRCEARVDKVIKESPLETATPVCHHFYECGGCSYQTIPYEKQLELKESLVKKLLQPYIDKTPDFQWEGILGSPENLHYKNKMEFTFGDEYIYGPMVLGLHQMNSTYDIVGVNSCAIIRPAWNEIIKYTQEFYRERKVPFYHRMKHIGILRNLVIRQSFDDGGILINLVTTAREDTNVASGNEVAEALAVLDLDNYVAGLVKLFDSDAIKSLEGHNKLAGVLHTFNDSFADAIIPERVTKLYGDDFLIEKVLGLEFKVTPFSFFQTNTKGCEVLYSRVREYVKEAYLENSNQGADKTETASVDSASGISTDNTSVAPSEELQKHGVIFDLYSGTGTIAQLMAPIAEKVIGIEIIEEAVESAKNYAKRNKLKNCEFIAGDVLKKLDEVEEKPDFIILDPPRDGCNPKALRKIIDYGVDSIVYISCKPTSLARDLEMFYESGYKMVKGCCVDQFPQTLHVECIACIQKIKDRKD